MRHHRTIFAYGHVWRPETRGKGTTELVAASGSGISVFDEAEITENAWFARVRHGFGKKWDLGIDALGYQFEGKQTITAKLSAR